MRLQGHLSEYPLRDLFTIFTNKCETGRLQIDFESAPSIFHFKDGKLIDAHVGPLEGFSAVNLAFSLADASFQFNTLTTVPKATINDPNQLILTRLLGINVKDVENGDNNAKESVPPPIPPATGANDVAQTETSQSPLSVHRNRVLRIASGTSTYVSRHTLAVTAAAILLLIEPALIVITVRLGKADGRTGTDIIARSSRPFSINPSDSVQSSTTSIDKPMFVNTQERQAAKPKSAVAKPKTALASTQSDEIRSDPELAATNDTTSPRNSTRVIAVVMQIEEGRVSAAYVKDHRPGLEAYEATAIRLARQRRYAKDKVGTETIVIKVTGEQ